MECRSVKMELYTWAFTLELTDFSWPLETRVGTLASGMLTTCRHPRMVCCLDRHHPVLGVPGSSEPSYCLMLSPSMRNVTGRCRDLTVRIHFGFRLMRIERATAWQSWTYDPTSGIVQHGARDIICTDNQTWRLLMLTDAGAQWAMMKRMLMMGFSNSSRIMPMYVASGMLVMHMQQCRAVQGLCSSFFGVTLLLSCSCLRT